MVLLWQLPEPFLRVLASKFGHARLQVWRVGIFCVMLCFADAAAALQHRFGGTRAYVVIVFNGGCKMAFNSMDWRQRAEEMRKIADPMPDLHAEQTMLAIAHDYELLAGQFEYLEKWQYGAADIAASARPIVDDDRLS